MRFDVRHPGLLQRRRGIAIAARLRRALQRHEVRRKFHVGRGGTAPALRGVITSVLDLVYLHLVEEVSAVQRFHHPVYRVAARW